ncbi:MAG: N-formylglutamate amidohydrolase [Qingshengfaniella sp.]
MNALPPIVLNPEGRFPGLIVVDHSGTSVPAPLNDLGLDPSWHTTHHFQDLGVADLARRIAACIDVPVVMNRVSRLVIDTNRWIADPASVVSVIDGTTVPANIALSTAERAARQDAVFWPFHAAVARAWDRQLAHHRQPLFFALHSCTRYFEGSRRSWDGGTIWHNDQTLSRNLLDILARDTSLVLGDNQPYTGVNGLYTVDRHTFGSGLPACGFEVTNDLLETENGRSRWADLLSDALTSITRLETAA